MDSMALEKGFFYIVTVLYAASCVIILTVKNLPLRYSCCQMGISIQGSLSPKSVALSAK